MDEGCNQLRPDSLCPAVAWEGSGGSGIRMRVLVQINSARLGGTEINALDLAAQVTEYGYESVIIAPRDTFKPGNSLLEVAKARGMSIVPFDRPASTLAGARTMRKLARQFNADLVHVYGSWTQRAAYWGPCALGSRPLVMTIYEMKVNADSVGMGAELIIGTRYLLEDIRHRRGGVHLISPPVDLERDTPSAMDTETFLASHGIPRGFSRIVIVSRLDHDLKALGIQLTMEACEQLSATGLQLIVVGTGDAENRLRSIAEAINARIGHKLIHMIGAMADPRPAYACADIVIGMGGSAARSLSFGKPLIVAGEFGWFKPFSADTSDELFRNSFWSDQVASDPKSSLVEALEDLLASPEKRIALGNYGRQFAEQNFGLKQMASKLAAIYDRAIANYGPLNWLSDIPLEARFLGRRFTSRRGFRPVMLHTPPSSGTDQAGGMRKK